MTKSALESYSHSITIFITYEYITSYRIHHHLDVLFMNNASSQTSLCFDSPGPTVFLQMLLMTGAHNVKHRAHNTSTWLDEVTIHTEIEVHRYRPGQPEWRRAGTNELIKPTKTHRFQKFCSTNFRTRFNYHILCMRCSSSSLWFLSIFFSPSSTASTCASPGEAQMANGFPYKCTLLDGDGLGTHRGYENLILNLSCITKGKCEELWRWRKKEWSRKNGGGRGCAAVVSIIQMRMNFAAPIRFSNWISIQLVGIGRTFVRLAHGASGRKRSSVARTGWRHNSSPNCDCITLEQWTCTRRRMGRLEWWDCDRLGRGLQITSSIALQSKVFRSMSNIIVRGASPGYSRLKERDKESSLI